jgi:hypothetical protein
VISITNLLCDSGCSLRGRTTLFDSMHGVSSVGCIEKSVLFGAFAELQKATVSFVISVRPSVR